MNKYKVVKEQAKAWIRSNIRIVAGIVLITLLFGNFIVAQTSDGDFWDNTSKYLAQILASDMQPGEGNLGADIADSTYLDSERPGRVTPAENLWVENDLEVGKLAYLNSTTTLQEVTYGSRLSKALTFTAGATTTPGGLFSLQNTGDTKICRAVEVDIVTAGGEDSVTLKFSVASSTASSSYSASGAGLIATTTVPTNTTLLLDEARYPGTFWEGLATTTSWLWERGVYLLGAFDSDDVLDHASSTGYTTMTGSMYVDCHTR